MAGSFSEGSRSPRGLLAAPWAWPRRSTSAASCEARRPERRNRAASAWRPPRGAADVERAERAGAGSTVSTFIALPRANLPACGAAYGPSVRTAGMLLAVQGAAVPDGPGGDAPLDPLAGRRLPSFGMVVSAARLAALLLVDWPPGLYLLMVVIGFGSRSRSPSAASPTPPWAVSRHRGERAAERQPTGPGRVVPMVVGLVAGLADPAVAFVSPAPLLGNSWVSCVFRSRQRGRG